MSDHGEERTDSLPVDVHLVLDAARRRSACDRCGGPVSSDSGAIVGLREPKRYCRSCARDGDDVDAKTRIVARLLDDVDFVERPLEDFFQKYRDDPDLADLLAAAAPNAHSHERSWLEQRFALLWDPQRGEGAIRSGDGAALLEDARQEILRRESATQLGDQAPAAKPDPAS